MMAYSAINTGNNDFRFGPDFLKQTASDNNIPIITSNLVYKNSKRPFGKKYAVLNAGSARIGVLGIISKNAFDNLQDQKQTADLQILDPENELRSLLPEIKKKTDIIILLSQSDYETTSGLVKTIDGIDLVILGKRKESEPLKTGGRILYSVFRGEKLGFIKFAADKSGKMVMAQKRLIELDSSIPADEQIKKMIDKAYYAMYKEKKRKWLEKKQREIDKEIKELWKLSPSEYIEMQKKKEYQSKRPKKEIKEE